MCIFLFLYPPCTNQQKVGDWVYKMLTIALMDFSLDNKKECDHFSLTLEILQEIDIYNNIPLFINLVLLLADQCVYFQTVLDSIL